MAKLDIYKGLITERINPRTTHIDRLDTPNILKLISQEDQKITRAVSKEKNNIAKAVDIIVAAFKGGGRLFFVGAGTSGRLGVLEAAECPPTFHTKPSQIQAIMAGGKKAVFKSREGAEDNAEAGASIIQKRVRAGDVVIGIAASGVTPFVLSALKTAKNLNCRTVLITCSKATPHPTLSHKGRGKKRTRFPEVTITLRVGPEVIAGSTRLKAGTATKMVLNMLTTTAMIRLGKVYGNRMVDLQIKSHKLQERAIRILNELAGLNRNQALHYIKESRGHVKTAILMARKNISYAQAQKLLRQNQGFLRSP